MTAHSLWPDTAKMMGAAPGVGVDDDGCRGSGQAARRSAAGFCAGRRPLNREQCMRGPAVFEAISRHRRTAATKGSGLRASLPLTYRLIRPCSGLNLIVTELPDMDLMPLRDASREA